MAPSMSLLLEVDQLSVHFGGLVALSSVVIEAYLGEAPTGFNGA